VVVRIALWFAGGTALFAGMYLTSMVLNSRNPPRWPEWWVGGVAFIGVELVVHFVIALRGRDGFYNGRG
jgi:hypothetical protein